MDTATKTAIDTLETAAKKVTCKAAEATGEFIGKKLLRKPWNQSLYLQGIQEMLKKLLSDSTASKFVTRKWIEVNDLSGSQYSVNKNLRFKTTFVRSNL